ncbi:MAG: PilZ domain-containing protein [Deltaproteobacteria bacterium]|nr:PilZ domain-containing protein [Deltaproteobacteria bacterium]
MQREKRKHPRIEVGCPVTIMTTEVDIDGEIENISAGGAYIRCRMLLFENDIFLMGIWDLEGEPLWIGAEVVWTNVTRTPDPEPDPIGMGVRFTTISDEGQRLLANIVSEHSRTRNDK